jgi:hypothetical protein
VYDSAHRYSFKVLKWNLKVTNLPQSKHYLTSQKQSMTVRDIIGIKDLPIADGPNDSATILELANCLRAYVHQYGENNQQFFVLDALAALTAARLEAGKSDVRFTATNIAAEAQIHVHEEKQPSAVISPIWKKLEAALNEREKGIQDFARGYGLTCYPWPKKEESKGGRGNNSTYYIESRLLLADDNKSAPDALDGEIIYIHELTPEPSWWAKRFISNGYRLEGWRRGLVMLYGAAILIAAGLSFAFALWIFLAKLSGLRAAEITNLFFSLAIFLAGLWFAFTPFARLFSWRIIMAPTFLIALKELNVQMEIVREPYPAPGNSGTIRLIRYAGACPVCRAKVELAAGGREFPNRLIGRCKEHPAQHVYSFDRFTCRGRSLR